MYAMLGSLQLKENCCQWFVAMAFMRFQQVKSLRLFHCWNGRLLCCFPRLPNPGESNGFLAISCHAKKIDHHLGRKRRRKLWLTGTKRTSTAFCRARLLIDITYTHNIIALKFQPSGLRLFRSMIPKNLRSKSFGTQSHLRIPITSNFPRMKFNIAQSIEIVKGLSDWIAFVFYVGTCFHSLSTVQDGRFADCRWCCCLNRWMHLSARVGGWLDLNILCWQDAPHIWRTIFAKCHPETSKHALLYCRERTPNEIAFNCRQIVWNLWRFLGAHIRTACGLSFWQVHRGESN